MLNRLLPALLVVAAVAIVAALPALALADDKANGTTHEGKIVRIDKDELVMTGTDDKQYTHKLNRDVKLRLDNKDVQIADITEFKTGMKVRVTTKKDDPKTVLKIEALSKGDFKN